MKKLSGISSEAIKRIAQVLNKEVPEDNQAPIDEVPVEEPTVPQEPGFNIGDETPIGIIRNITQRNGEAVYIVGGNENGAFAQLMNKKDLEREILREEQKQEKQKKLEEEQSVETERNNLQGFTDNLSPRQKGQVEKFLLNVSIKYKGSEYRPKEFVEKLLEEGYTPATVLGKPAASLPDGTYVNLQKTSYEYMSYLANL